MTASIFGAHHVFFMCIFNRSALQGPLDFTAIFKQKTHREVFHFRGSLKLFCIFNFFSKLRLSLENRPIYGPLTSPGDPPKHVWEVGDDFLEAHCHEDQYKTPKKQHRTTLIFFKKKTRHIYRDFGIIGQNSQESGFRGRAPIWSCVSPTDLSFWHNQAWSQVR